MPPLCRRSSGRAGSFIAKHTLDPQPGATGRPRNRDGQSVVQRQPQRSSWTRNRTTRPESGEPRWMVPDHTVDAHRNQYPEKPGSWLRRIQVAITAGHRGNRGNASAGKHGDHQARAARAGVVVVEIRLDSVVPGTGCRQADNGVVVDRPVRGYEERPMPACVGIGCRRFVPTRCRLRRVPTTPAGSLAGVPRKMPHSDGRGPTGHRESGRHQKASDASGECDATTLPTWVSKSS